MKQKTCKCLYCWNIWKMTKEHVFTKSIVKEFFWWNWWLWYRNETQRYSIDNQTLNKVCEKCNNEIFSQLDNKMKSFLELNFHKTLIYMWDKIKFQYNFYDLTRWILKTLNNSYAKNWYVTEDKSDFITQYKDYILWNTENINFTCYVEVLRDIPLLDENNPFKYWEESQEEYKKRSRIIKTSNLCIRTNEKIHIIWKMLTIWDFIFYVFDKTFEESDNFIKQKWIIAQKLNENETNITLIVGATSFFDIVTSVYEWSKLHKFWKYYDEYKLKSKSNNK